LQWLPNAVGPLIDIILLSALLRKMAARKATNIFARVRRLDLALPEVEESTSFGAPALKVGGAMFTCIPANKSAETRRPRRH
jgi:hypothetical protein